MARNDFNFHNPVSGSAFGENAQVYNYYADKQDAFVEITIADLKLRSQELQNIRYESLLTRLQEEKLLVLGGNFGINKNDLALHLAFILAQNNQTGTPQSDENNLTIKQWNRRALNMDREFYKAESLTIFILTEVEAKNVGFDWFRQTHKTAKELSKHYVVVSTDRSFTSWHLEENARQFFPVISFQDIFDSDGLLRELTEQLNKDNLLPELTPYLENEGQSLQSVAEQLHTPTNITRFVELFRQGIKRSKEVPEDNQENKPIKINELIQIARSDEQFIRKLYYNILNPREQLLALGLSFFNGLFEDQLFAALERVVQDVWQKRDPSLISLDYCDLEQLQTQYFDLYKNNLYESKPDDFKVVKAKDYEIDLRSIKILSVENRQLLFKIAWESHRRQIVTALDVLVDLVEESVVKENYYGKGRWELYGDSIQQEKLRHVISETLTDIGLVSTSAFSAVEGLLFRIAINGDWQVRQVAASAIARWYPVNRENLFRIIQKFYNIALQKERKESDDEQLRWREVEKTEESSQKDKKSESEKPKKPHKFLDINWWKSLIKSFFNKKPKAEDYYTKREPELEDYIGSTVAVAIGETIYEYYGTNELSDDFYNWLEELLESRLRLVHLEFAYHTLLYAAPLHFQDERIRQILKDLTEREKYCFSPKSPELFPSLNHAIARALADAYIDPQNSQQVKQTLYDWYKEGKNRPSEIDTEKITKNDTLLTTIALTYGLIPYEINPYLKVNNGLSKLAEILEEEKHPFIRKAVVFAICCLTRRYFNQIASQLQDILSDFTQGEQKEIVKILTEIYLEERVNINGNVPEVEVRKIQHKGKKYQVWKKPEKRPMTPIEEAMKNWAKLENKAPAQQTAIQSLVAFANELK